MSRLARPGRRSPSSRLLGLVIGAAVILLYLFVLSRGAWP